MALEEYSYKDLVNDAVGYWECGSCIGSSVDFALDGAYLSLGKTGEKWLKDENKSKKDFTADVVKKIREIRRKGE